MALTDKSCKAAKACSKPYKLGDSGGMYLEVMPNGSKYWRLKYRFAGKEKRLALGVYPEVPLLTARNRRDAARQLLAIDIDPSVAKKNNKRLLVQNAANSFEVLAREWHEHRKGGWAARHAANILARMEKDLIPELGPLPVADINSEQVLDMVRRIEARGANETARRSLQVCRQIFTYAVGTSRAKNNPASGLHSLLKPYKKGHFATIEAKELSNFLAALDHNDARLYMLTRFATKMLMLTLVRTNELIGARWEEFDIAGKEWIIPAVRMLKSKQSHIVPLSTQVIALLREIKPLVGNSALLFPNQARPNKTMSEGTILGAIKRIGYKGKQTGHGFRALGASTIAERLGYRREVVDRQLAHTPKSKTDPAYHRADFISERREMMQAWANLVDELATGKGNATPLRRKTAA